MNQACSPISLHQFFLSLEAGALGCWFEGLNKVLTMVLIYQYGAFLTHIIYADASLYRIGEASTLLLSSHGMPNNIIPK